MTVEPFHIEIIVVDNASNDGSPQMVSDLFPNIKLIKNSINRGFACANNQGIQASNGRYLLLLNSDAILNPGSLAAMISFMESHPLAAAIGPKLVNLDGSFQASYAPFPTLSSEFALVTGLAKWSIGPYAPSPSPIAGEVAQPVDWVAGAALMVRASIIDQVRLLDEDYFLYSEETDWCRRIWQAGAEVWYTPDIEVIHHGGASTRQHSTKSYLALYQSKLLYFRKSYGVFSANLLRALYFLVFSTRVLVWSVATVFTIHADKIMHYQQKAQRDYALLTSLIRRNRTSRTPNP